MAGSVSPNSNPVRETVMTVHPLNPIRPNLLSLVNRLLPVLDGTFGSGDRYDRSSAQPNPSQSSQPREPVITRSRWHIWSTFQFELKSLWVML
ncbi:hypothetical protein V6N11_050315 [Hibiscus sabdariffa]|uniref:Uncharacterized protein n=1 Tax=Hibiscus sabdariffa TaxID=183260 RepID=A0ABR2T9E8_9ROSI